MPFGHPLVYLISSSMIHFSISTINTKVYVGLGQRPRESPENIHELLTPRALAYWFMDDGNSDQNGRHLLRPPICFRLTHFLEAIKHF